MDDNDRLDEPESWMPIVGSYFTSGSHFLRAGAVVDVHFPSVYTAQPWMNRPSMDHDFSFFRFMEPTPGWYTATVRVAPEFRPAGMPMFGGPPNVDEWVAELEFFDTSLANPNMTQGRLNVTLSLPSVPPVYQGEITAVTLYDDDGARDVAGPVPSEHQGQHPMPAPPDPVDLAQWIRPSETPVFAEALHRTSQMVDEAQCDLCASPMISCCNYALSSPGVYVPAMGNMCPTGPAVCPAVTCHRSVCQANLRHLAGYLGTGDAFMFRRSSTGVAPSHLPNGAPHPLRDFRREVVVGDAREPWNWCACDSQSRASAILQLIKVRSSMQHDLTKLRIITAKAYEQYNANPSLSFVSGPAWWDEVWQLVICIAGMPSRSH